MRQRPENPPDLSRVKNILVIVLRNIGDVVLSSPVFDALKERIPSSEIDALVNSGTEDVLIGNPSIDHIHVLNREVKDRGMASRIVEERRLLKAIRLAGYDMAVVLTTGTRALNLAYLSGAKIRVGVKPKRRHFPYVRFLTHPVEMARSGRHYVERYLDVLRGIGMEIDFKTAETSFYEGRIASLKIRELLGKAGAREDAPYIVVHPTSRWMFKCWPHEKTAELIDKIRGELKITVVLTSGPGEAEETYIKNLLSRLKTDVVDLSRMLSLRELGALIRGARLFCGVDSAPMHIAAAVKTPVAALFGPTSEADWGPWGQGHRVITSYGYNHCRPCGKDGCGGTKVSECLTSIEVSTVFDAVKELLNNPLPGAVKKERFKKTEPQAL